MKNGLRNSLAALCLGAKLLSPVKSDASEVIMEAGIMPNAVWLNPNGDSYYNKDVLFQTIGLELDFLNLPKFKFIPETHFFVGGKMTIFEVPQNNTVSPWVFYSSIIASAGIRFGEDFRIFYEHRSNHPMDPYSVPMMALDQFYDRILLEYKKKF
jgi:hypothetical protein